MGNHLPHPVTTKIIDREGNEFFRAAAVSMNGYREAMEDAHAISINEKYGYFAVFDGHSGSQCSTFCSKRFPEEVSKAGPPLSAEKLTEIVLKTDSDFMASCKDSGSTATMCIALRNADGTFSLQVGNVGDSRIIIGKDGKTCLSMTTDHKPSLEAEKERIVQCGGTVHMDRVDGMLAMSRAMGDCEYKQGTGGPLMQKVIAKPDVSEAVCGPNDWVLVACDGIFESNFSNEQVVDFIVSQFEITNDLGVIMSNLCDEALKRGSSDNMTAMLVQFADGRPFKAPREVVAGPFHPEKPNFRKAYRGMADRAGITLGRCLELRYDVVRQQMVSRLAELKLDDAQQGADDVVKALRDELAHFKPGPAKSLTGQERTKWFEDLAAKLDSTEDAGGREFALDADTMQKLKEHLSGGGGGGLASLLGLMQASGHHIVEDDED
eukprot:TRINITY_DN92992_c0_g1_i1.p1 TRINITY_DN92992_c0_g1~~TRINITY_DN92992_c0_g1_i1.p1  ORF type:complete len:436 (-),score=78.17 TRINITY_DN92992_c0_g1_i1:337-1644(-)